MKKINWIVLPFLLFVLQMSGQTITLIPDPTLVISPANCMTVELGSTLNFQRDPACGPNVIISDDLGASALFTSSATSFSYTFDEPGEYVLFCNASPTSVAVTALCITVPERIPTMGQWGVIILFLMLLIIMVLAYSKDTLLSKRQDVMVASKRD